MAFDRPEAPMTSSTACYAGGDHYGLRTQLNQYFDGTWQVRSGTPALIESAPLEPAYAATVAQAMNGVLETSASPARVEAAPCERIHGFSRVQMGIDTAQALVEAAKAKEAQQETSLSHRIGKRIKTALSYTPATDLGPDNAQPKPSSRAR